MTSKPVDPKPIVPVVLKERDINTHSAYIQGYPDQTFRLNAPVTRAQMAAMLAKNSGYSEETDETNLYNDVLKTHWAYNDILIVKKTGFMVGDGKTFNPSDSITCTQMATIVYRWGENACEKDPDAYEQCANLSNIDAVSYTDVSSEHSVAQAIIAIQKFKITGGYGDGTFRPKEKLTRADPITHLYFRYIVLIIKLAGHDKKVYRIVDNFYEKMSFYQKATLVVSNLSTGDGFNDQFNNLRTCGEDACELA